MDRIGTKLHPYQITKKILLVATTFITSGAQGKEILVDRLVAIVNDQPITYNQVMEKVEKGPLVQVSPHPKNENGTPFEIALHDLINLTLISQKAAELDITIENDALNDEIESFAKKRQLTLSQLKEAVQNQGMSYDRYRQDFRNQIILSQFQGRVIFPSIKITDRDIELYYIKKSGNLNDNMKLTLRQLFIAIDPTANEALKEGKIELADEIYQKIVSGFNFIEAVRIYSDNKENRETGGLMTDLYLKDLAKPFRTAIEPLKPQQTTPPIKTNNGIYIFLLEEKSFAGSTDFHKKKERLTTELRQEEISSQTIYWLEEERQKSKIKILLDHPSN